MDTYIGRFQEQHNMKEVTINRGIKQKQHNITKISRWNMSDLVEVKQDD